MLTIKAIEDVNEPNFRQMIFAYWQELMPKAAVLQTSEKRDAYFESDFASGEVYGAWLDDELVGYTHIRVKADVGHIEGIYVIPEVRRNRFGKLLMEWAFKQFDQRGIEQIDLYVRRDNPRAKAFYESMGFDVAGYRMRLYREDG